MEWIRSWKALKTTFHLSTSISLSSYVCFEENIQLWKTSKFDTEGFAFPWFTLFLVWETAEKGEWKLFGDFLLLNEERDGGQVVFMHLSPSLFLPDRQEIHVNKLISFLAHFSWKMRTEFFLESVEDMGCYSLSGFQNIFPWDEHPRTWFCKKQGRNWLLLYWYSSRICQQHLPRFFKLITRLGYYVFIL